MAAVRIDSGEIPSAKGVAEGWNLSQVVRRWQSIAHGRFRDDCRFLRQMIQETEELRLWEKNCGGFTYPSRDEFLQKQVLINYELTRQDFRAILLSIEHGNEEAAAAIFRRTPAAISRSASPLAQHGGDHTSEQGKATLQRNVAKQGNNVSYLASRLKRDRPDLAARVEAGEFKSMRAAAIEAGIVKVPSALVLLKRAWEKATPEEREEFNQWIEKCSLRGRDGLG